MSIPVAHISMQYSDNHDQIRSDFNKLFDRANDLGWWWITGTEMGDNANSNIAKDVADQHGYRYSRPGGDTWIAVDRNRIKSDFTSSWKKVVDGEAGKYTNKGVAGVHFINHDLGDIHIATAHYITKGRPNADNPEYEQNLDKNKKIAKAIGDFARDNDGLVFYGGDQNIPDKDNDTFLGEPLTSGWDQLKKWPNTGHGCIDVVATADKNKNTKVTAGKVLDDSEFKLHTDHWLVQSTFTVTD